MLQLGHVVNVLELMDEIGRSEAFEEFIIVLGWVLTLFLLLLLLLRLLRLLTSLGLLVQMHTVLLVEYVVSGEYLPVRQPRPCLQFLDGVELDQFQGVLLHASEYFRYDSLIFDGVERACRV
jgi:hypothetical protein